MTPIKHRIQQQTCFACFDPKEWFFLEILTLVTWLKVNTLLIRCFYKELSLAEMEINPFINCFKSSGSFSLNYFMINLFLFCFGKLPFCINIVFLFVFVFILPICNSIQFITILRKVFFIFSAAYNGSIFCKITWKHKNMFYFLMMGVPFLY